MILGEILYWNVYKKYLSNIMTEGLYCNSGSHNQMWWRNKDFIWKYKYIYFFIAFQSGVERGCSSAMCNNTWCLPCNPEYPQVVYHVPIDHLATIPVESKIYSQHRIIKVEGEKKRYNQILNTSRDVLFVRFDNLFIRLD